MSVGRLVTPCILLCALVYQVPQSYAKSAKQFDPVKISCQKYHKQNLSLKDTQLERVDNIPLAYSGFNILEGPVWLDGALYYSNMGSRKVGEQTMDQLSTLWRWQPGQDPQVWLADDQAGTNGLAINRQGNLVVARQLDGSISIIDKKKKTLTPLATTYEDKRFNSPNDVVVAKDGTIYFTDPNWSTPSNVDLKTVQGGGQPGEMIPGQRIYRIDPAGIVSALSVTEQVPELRDKPNGIILSADEKQLFVGGLRGLWAFDMTQGQPRLARKVLSSAIDGMGMDCAGNLYVATIRKLPQRTDGQVVVVLDKTLQELGVIEVPAVQLVTNVTFGGPEYKTLYVTSLGTESTPENPSLCGNDPCVRASIFKMELNIPGLPY